MGGWRRRGRPARAAREACAPRRRRRGRAGECSFSLDRTRHCESQRQPLTAHVSPQIADLAHTYEPAELADLVLACGPARERGVARRAYLLRTSRLLARPLADLGPATRALVATEPLAELRLLLDLMYGPAPRPETRSRSSRSQTSMRRPR
jgi:hypothetical protein